MSWFSPQVWSSLNFVCPTVLLIGSGHRVSCHAPHTSSYLLLTENAWFAKLFSLFKLCAQSWNHVWCLKELAKLSFLIQDSRFVPNLSHLRVKVHSWVTWTGGTRGTDSSASENVQRSDTARQSEAWQRVQREAVFWCFECWEENGPPAWQTGTAKNTITLWAPPKPCSLVTGRRSAVFSMQRVMRWSSAPFSSLTTVVKYSREPGSALPMSRPLVNSDLQKRWNLSFSQSIHWLILKLSVRVALIRWTEVAGQDPLKGFKAYHCCSVPHKCRSPNCKVLFKLCQILAWEKPLQGKNVETLQDMSGAHYGKCSQLQILLHSSFIFSTPSYVPIFHTTVLVRF